jgi:hypothetical protein
MLRVKHGECPVDPVLRLVTGAADLEVTLGVECPLRPNRRCALASADDWFEEFTVAEDGDGAAGRRAHLARRLDAEQAQHGRGNVGR